MPSYKDLWPDRWIKPEIIGNKRVRVTIESVRVEKLFNPTSKRDEDRLIAKFHGKELRLILNKTNAQTLERIFNTDDFGKWHDKEIALTTGKAPNGKQTIVINQVGGASPPPPAATSAPATNGPDDDLWEPTKPVKDVDEDFYPAATPEKAGARPGANIEKSMHGQGVAPENGGARPTGSYGGQDLKGGIGGPCLMCHAPAGKPHASTCPTRNERATPENVVARPGVASASTAHSPQPTAAPSARPGPSFEDRIFTAVSHLYKSSVPMNEETTTFIRKCRNADSDSALKATAKEMAVVIKGIGETLAAEEIEAEMILAALLGYRCTAKHLPGQLVFNYILKPLRAFDELALMATGELLELCQAIYLEEAETA